MARNFFISKPQNFIPQVNTGGKSFRTYHHYLFAVFANEVKLPLFLIKVQKRSPRSEKNLAIPRGPFSIHLCESLSLRSAFSW
jgi:hypothetical protein